MSDRLESPGPKPTDHEADVNWLELRSTRMALAIALMPIPIALVISWVLGSPPWLDRPGPSPEGRPDAVAPDDAPEHPPGWQGHGPHGFRRPEERLRPGPDLVDH